MKHQRGWDGECEKPDEGALDMFCRRIGSDLRRLRKLRGLTQAAAADTVGVSRFTLTRIEGGDMGVALGTIVALAKLYDAPPSFLVLVGGGDEPHELVNEAAL